MKQIVVSSVEMNEISDVNKLLQNWRKSNKERAKRLGAKRISGEAHGTILDEVSHREALDYDKELRVDEGNEDIEDDADLPSCCSHSTS
jgi:hypothetical protein